ncbi:MAG TPA: cytochrome c [Burkholderiales bacterium]|nr:cytochrome c [Burkholderiales bacterium]
MNRAWTMLLALVTGSALADEAQVHLKDGPGKALVEANCSMCHSLDYIPMNSPFLDRKGWEASVTKMIKAMGAPIREQDVGAIVDYLNANYGKR